MQEIIEMLFNTDYGQYVMAACLLCRVFVTVAPVKLTMHIPDVLMMLISAMALASNKRADNKGNPV
tara:strand:+ start:5148 stop:5345 length:198 start_codon:yes stop_codon:yes gene_type:complete